MKNLSKQDRITAKVHFKDALKKFVEGLNGYVADDQGQWTVKGFIDFFACEKWEIASDKQGSGNTANIGSITYIDDILKGNGVFAKLGEEWFDEYWMNYGITTMMKKRKAVPIRKLEDFIAFKGGDPKLINRFVTKTRSVL